MSVSAANALPPPSAAMRSFEAQWRSRGADALLPVREQAMQRFLRLGLPTMRDESWRYTDLRSLAQQSFADATTVLNAVEPQASLSLIDGKSRAATVLMVNGIPSLDDDEVVINDFEISTLKRLSKTNPKALLRFFESDSDADQRRFT